VQFSTVDTIHASDGSGLVAHITSRPTAQGYVHYTVNFAREYEIPGQTETRRTSFLPYRSFPALRQLIDEAESRIRLEQDKLATKRRVAR